MAKKEAIEVEGKVEEAKKHLQNLVNQSPDSVFRKTAETQMLLP